MSLQAPYDPVELRDVDKAFPAHALDWMPEHDDIPERWREADESDWQVRLWRNLMFRGLTDIQLAPRDKSWGQVEVDRAWTHLQAILGSFAPKHQHKEAALAFLTDRWFEAIRWKPLKDVMGKKIDDPEWDGPDDVDWP